MSQPSLELWVCGELCPLAEAVDCSREKRVAITLTRRISLRKLPWLEQVHLLPCPEVVTEIATEYNTSAHAEEVWGCMQRQLRDDCKTVENVVVGEYL